VIISRFYIFSDMPKESKLPVTDRCRLQSPDRMVNSCSAVTSSDLAASTVASNDISSAPLMTRSLDPALLFTSASVNLDTSKSDQSENSATQLVLEECSTGSRCVSYQRCRHSRSSLICLFLLCIAVRREPS
jgi:hypothetical protein